MSTAKPFSIIVALDQKHGIGKNNDLVWRLPGDMTYFKTLTTTAATGKSNAVIMGRKTWDSIPQKFRPLPNRKNVILTRNASYTEENASTFNSLQHALSALQSDPEVDQIFVIGGGSIYTEAIQHTACNTLYITQVEAEFDCDTFFPDIPSPFKRLSASTPKTENGSTYRFETYSKA